MAYITTTVGVKVYLEEFDDDSLVDELESRGYEVFDKDKAISDLYSTYMTCSKELFDKELKKFFRENLDAGVY